MNDPFNLGRFVEAQNAEWDSILSELRKGHKTSHWMWFVFPQMKGLGSSSTADYFGISSPAEAAAYLNHKVLGPRLSETTALVNAVNGSSAEAIFGAVDSLKFRSSITLFKTVAADPEVFQQALDKYFSGQPDSLTLNLLGHRVTGHSG